jgi:hypothetical protein
VEVKNILKVSVMKKNFFVYILLIVLMGTVISLASCDDDDLTAAQSGSKWNTTYVTLHPSNYLKPLPSFTLNHSRENGVDGKVNIQYIVMTSKAATHDIIVDVEIECNIPISNSKIELSASNLKIKAGENKSEPVTLNISDWSELESVKDKQDYALTIKMKNITSQNKYISKGEFYTEIVLNIVKKPAL